MHGKLTRIATAAVAAGAMTAAGVGSVQAAQAAVGVVRVPCSASALAADMTSPASGETLSLAPRCTYNLTAGLPVVNVSLTILGNEATLLRSFARGTPAFTILEVDSGSTVISRLNFRNGRGAIVLNDHGNLTVQGGTFTGNQATDGGAILDDSDTAFPSTVTGATFIGNKATGGGAFCDVSLGGDNVTDSTFIGNKATDGGAYLDNAAIGDNVVGSAFYRNTAAYGGAIYSNANNGTDLSNITVSGNNARTGGGIYSTAPLFVLDSQLSGNHATGAGGGIYTFSPQNSTVTRTAVRGNGARQGGGIYDQDGLLNFTNSQLSGNRASADGGGIYNGSFRELVVVNFTGSGISGNRAGGSGGGIFNQGQLTATDTWIAGNRAIIAGGGIDDDDAGTTTLTNSPVLVNKPDNCAPAGSITGCTG